jgi:hypothetical protein
MAQAPTGRMAAVKDDGFIDFYELLEVAPDATLTRIRTTINALYNEAQANRDHRNLNRRREYQMLLQVLPQAREFLLEDKMRARYDNFRDEVERGSAAISFEDWARQIKEEEEGTGSDRSAVLGVQGDEQDIVPRATVIKTTQKPKPRSRVLVGDESASQPRLSTRQSLTGSAISVVVFFLLLVVSVLVLRFDLTVGLLVAAIGGLIAWFATHRKTSRRTSV